MKKLWNIELNDQKNITLAFTYKTTTTTFLQLNLAASNEYQIFCNKKFIAYGPMRSAHGFSNLRSYQLFPNKQKCINLVIFVCGSQINSYDRINEQPFFSAEIFMNSKLIATSFDFKAFLINDRIQKVQRYSFQRTFTESYHYSQNRKNLLYGKSHNYPSVSLKEVASNNILNNCFLSEPDYHFIKSKIFECGYAYINSGKKTYRDRSLTGEGCNKNYLIFREEELYENLSSEAGKIDCIPANIPIDVLNKNNYILYELKRNSSGFFSFNINVLQKTTLYVLFDEILSNNKENKIDINRLQCCNAIKYVFDKGYYPVITFSPYTAKYISLVIIDGQAKINHFGMISYENPDDHLNISCHDAEIKKIIDAARATFRQNAVDILTDCPSRERAGWLCDSFFTARAEKFITGDNLVEKNFLRSYLLAPNFISAPGIIPMCYPADHVDGTYIPNWAMWFIIEDRKSTL